MEYNHDKNETIYIYNSTCIENIHIMEELDEKTFLISTRKDIFHDAKNDQEDNHTNNGK